MRRSWTSVPPVLREYAHASSHQQRRARATILYCSSPPFYFSLTHISLPCVPRNPLPSAVGCACTGQTLCSTYSRPPTVFPYHTYIDTNIFDFIYLFILGTQKNVVAIGAFATSSNATKSPAVLASKNVAPLSNARKASASALVNRMHSSLPPRAQRVCYSLLTLITRSLTACGTRCVNTLNDSRNCGRCVRQLPSFFFSFFFFGTAR